MHRPSESLSDNSAEPNRRVELLIEFWTALDNDGDPGGTTWEALDRIRDKVTTALRKRPPDVSLAESLTAKAALLIAGCRDT